MSKNSKIGNKREILMRYYNICIKSGTDLINEG